MRDDLKARRFTPLDPVAIGERLRLIREAKGYNQAQMVSALGTDTSSWNRWEKGQRPVKAEIVDRIFQLWGIDHSYVYRGREANLPDFLREHLERVRRSA